MLTCWPLLCFFSLWVHSSKAKEGSVIAFNQAFAANVPSNVQQLMGVPWSRILYILSAGFNTMYGAKHRNKLQTQI
jgi:hypothetical protein